MQRILIFVSLNVPANKVEFLGKHSKKINPFTPLNYSQKLFDSLRTSYSKVLRVNFSPIGSFPNHSDLFFVSKRTGLTDFSFLNVWGFRNISLSHSAKRFCHRTLLSSLSDDKCICDIVAVEMHYPILSLSCYLHKVLPNSTLTVVTPDLPEYMSPNNRAFFYRLAKNVDNKKIQRMCAKNANGYLFFTEAMNAVANPTKKPYFIFEGIAEPMFPESEIRPVPRRVVYTGTTDLDYSRLDLAVEAIAILKKKDPSYELVVSGGGNGDSFLLNQARKGLVHYLGVIPPEQTINLQKTASVLLCLRNPSEKTKYSFPSKILEYLRTGQPVVCNRLPGISAEYSNVLCFVESLDAENLARVIEKSCSIPADTLCSRRDAIANLLKKKTGDSISSSFMKLLSLY